MNPDKKAKYIKSQGIVFRDQKSPRNAAKAKKRALENKKNPHE